MVPHFYRNWIIRIMGFGHGEDTRTKPLSTVHQEFRPLQPGIYSALSSYILIFNNINDSKSANRMLNIRLYGIIN